MILAEVALVSSNVAVERVGLLYVCLQENVLQKLERLNQDGSSESRAY